MAVTRESLRKRSQAEQDFYSPMTGGTQIRYADAPIPRRDTYGSRVKDRLGEIGQGTRRAAPIIEAIKVAVQKTEDPFTQIKEQKSYAPQEENDIMGALEGAAGAAQDAIGEGVAQAENAVESFRKSSNRRAAERRAERQADLKAARDARQNIRSDFQNRIKGVSDEVGGVRQQVKTYESNREKQRRLTQARLKGIEKDVGGVRSEVKAYETNREKQRRLTQARLKGIESRQDRTAKETKDYRTRREQMRAQRQEAVDRRLGEQDKKVSEVKTNLATTYGGVVGLQKSLADIKARREAPKTVTVGGQTVAAKQSVASLPSNYKSTEAAAFAKAKRFQEAKKIAQRNPNVSISKTTGKAEATNNSARARAQAAAVNRKMSGKSISQTKAANRASMKQAAKARHASFKKAKAAGTHARTASAQRARNRAAAKARAKAAAKRRRSKKKGKKCDISLKYDISLLTNHNLRHDELAEVAYFVRALREVEL